MLTNGCFVLALKLKNGQSEALTMHKSQKGVNLMAARENVMSLQYRYLTKNERQQCKHLVTKATAEVK